jgi:hypothetical protein
MVFIRFARGVLFTALLAVPYATTLAADGRVTLGTGAEYTTGKYGHTQDTEIVYLPITGKYEIGPWALKLVVPYISITGPSNVVGATDPITVPARSQNDGFQSRTASGLGDIVGSAFYNVLSERDSPFGFDVGAKVKFGTADRAAGLGTGKNDFALQTDVFKPIGALTAFGSIGYRWYGDLPGVPLRNVFYGSVGGSYRMSSRTSVGLVYDFRPRVTPTGGRRSEATAFVSQRLSRNWKLQLYGLTGFSSASPDFGAGIVINYNF